VVFTLGAIYLVLLFTLGYLTLKKGHVLLFVVGIFLPFFWLIGALIRPRGLQPS
jgi:hypothetical protein